MGLSRRALETVLNKLQQNFHNENCWLKLVAEAIAAKRVNLSLEEARELAKRAQRFKQEKGRLPSLTAADPWEKPMAEGIAVLKRKVIEEKNA